MDERILKTLGVISNGLQAIYSILYCLARRRARLVKSSSLFSNTFIVEYGSPPDEKAPKTFI